MTLDEKALEIAAKRLCMTAMGGDNEQNHSRIALAWGMRADRYRNEAQAAITAYLSALSEKGEQLMPNVVIAQMYRALCGARHALDLLMGDTDPDDETPSVLAMQGIQEAIEAADALDAHSEPRQ